MERLISYKEMHEINKYFDLYNGKPARLSEMRAARPAIEVLAFEGKVAIQAHLFDKDATVFPSGEIVKSDIPDNSEYYSNGDRM